MLGWSLTLFVLALVAAALGFGGIVGATAQVAQVLFVVFTVMFLATVISRKLRGKPPL